MAGFRLGPKAARARRTPWQKHIRQRLIRTAIPVFDYPVSASDSFTVNDTATVSVALVVSATDTVNISDAAGTQQVLSVSVFDTITVSDTASAGFVSSSPTAQGGMVWLFTPTQGIVYIRGATDTITVADSATGTVAGASSYNVSAQDNLVITDSVTAVFQSSYGNAVVIQMISTTPPINSRISGTITSVTVSPPPAIYLQPNTVTTDAADNVLINGY